MLQPLLFLKVVLQLLDGLHLILEQLVVLLNYFVSEDQVLLSRVILPKLHIRVLLFLDFFQGVLDVVSELNDHSFEVFPLNANRVVH